MYICVYIYVYIYTYIERHREGERVNPMYASFQPIVYIVHNNQSISSVNNTNQPSRRYFGKVFCAGPRRANGEEICQ